LANADGPATPALADAMASAKQPADTITSVGGAGSDVDQPQVAGFRRRLTPRAGQV